MKKILLLLLFLPIVTPTTVFANVTNYESSTIVENPRIFLTQTSFNYQIYNEILKTYVSDRGLVDYQKLQASPQDLEQFNQALAGVSSATYNSWSQPERLAFLLNAYNSLTLQSIIGQNPLKKSIRDIPGVWNRRKFAIAGQEKTLDNIEHDIIRKDFNEPRIHMALVCAAMSCPILRNAAYTAANLDSQLDEQTRKFLTSPQGFKIDRNQNIVYLSSIFKWYGQDWIASYGINDKFTGNRKEKAVLNFISQYLDSQDSQYLEQGKYKISYLKYDWSLNQQGS
ncbi:Protein of unknown function, DUF547 [Xenococcus sp. PCC 7305]|uniref:DUF547 domain-containing protein n=1 Tax=Xenococcus sp. PCC 7305 TaxID=102125 RepID=UPI0002ABD4C3|nr:DUF547 domain-containing protein [Xenococcus sp. PCC 7305]ELS00526.1 Protein of unknown function, DUF547 [Xenococcus sp. PCC 7305]